MPELKEVINVSTGEKETVEYYTHDEFMEKKRAKLKQMESQANELGSVVIDEFSAMDALLHYKKCFELFIEWKQVCSAVGPMVVKEK